MADNNAGATMSESKDQLPTCAIAVGLTWNSVSKTYISTETLAGFWRWIVLTTKVLLILIASYYPALAILERHPAMFLLAVFIAFVCSVVSILVHEIGHAVAAWFAGRRVHLIVVGTRAFAPQRKKFIRVPAHGQHRDLGGWVLATPPPDSAWSEGLILFVLGGVLGNLSLGVVSMLAAFAMYNVELQVFAVLMGLGGVSLVFAVANLVPFSRPGAWQSDGATLLQALNGEEPSLVDQNITRLLGMVHDGVPAEDWDLSILNQLIDAQSGDREKIDPLLFSYAFSTGDLATAKPILERILEAHPHGAFEYQCMHAFIITMLDRDPQRAAQILEKLPRKSAKESYSYWRAQAVTAHVLGKRDEALEAVLRTRRAASKFGLPPDKDDEMVIQAIEQGQDLPRLVPRGQLSLNDEDLSGTGATTDAEA